MEHEYLRILLSDLLKSGLANGYDETARCVIEQAEDLSEEDWGNLSGTEVFKSGTCCNMRKLQRLVHTTARKGHKLETVWAGLLWTLR
jgi:hypothetical protein